MKRNPELLQAATVGRLAERNPIVDFLTRANNPNDLKPMYTNEWWGGNVFDDLSVRIAGDIYEYDDRRVVLSHKKSWILNPGDLVMIMHLDLSPRMQDRAMNEVGRVVANTKHALLRMTAELITMKREDPVSYVMASTNEKMVVALRHMLPGFEVLGVLPNAYLRREILSRVAEYDKDLAKLYERLTCPVVAISVADFIESATSRLRPR